MQIRKIGRRPEREYAAIPNVMLRDERLSFRARGILSYIESHTDGFHVNAESLCRVGREGREAIRTAMNELRDAGYLRMVRWQDADSGRWATRLDVYVWGDAPDLPVDADAPDVVDEIDEAPETPFQPSDNPAPETRPREPVEYKKPSENTNENAAAGDLPMEVTQQQQMSQICDVKPFPTVEQRKLVDWFSVPATSGPAWVAAWETAQSFVMAQPSVEYDPQAHLAIYLSRCREERRAPRSDLWLRFFIEDRAKHIVVLREEAEMVDHHHETPQEREDRLNRRLPPDWGAEPAAATTGENP